jgi:gliding motility-associated-like protein
MLNFRLTEASFLKAASKYVLLLVLFVAVNTGLKAQCPPNIDFELGDFTGWKCYSGTFNGVVSMNPFPIPPAPGRHDMISASTVPANDQWGNFPKLCPNGSNHSIRIGLETTGTTADRVVYTFTIPAGQNQFSLIYNYAIVINNAGGHAATIQPRLTVSVNNLTDNKIDTCSSFDIAYSNADTLPGFLPSPGNPNIKFKPWAANSIKLDGNAGKTIELSFTSTGCGAVGGTHFGYAYLDLNAECSSSFIGAVFCPDDVFINVTAPFGYRTYKWWDITDPSITLATTQTINFTPPPPSGTVLKVAVAPYPRYGCPDTLTAVLLDTLTIQSNAGPDRLSCQNAPVQLGAPPKATYVYSWSPVTGLSNPNIANPIATPSVTTEYVVSTTSAGGGCLTTDTVLVKAVVIDNSMQVLGPTTGCITGANPTILEVMPEDSIQWYRNNVPIPAANQTQYNVVQSGTYRATLFSFTGCNLSTADIVITANPLPVVGFTSNALTQCFNGHQFIFTNTSSIAFGTMTYNWDLGDGNLSNLQNITHSYALPGTYPVRLVVVSDQGCTDSASYTVTVFDSPVAAFNSNATESCFKVNRFDFFNSSTLAVGNMRYNWSFGDGFSDTTRDVSHVYVGPGTYTVRLTVTTEKGCANDSAFDVTVHPEPVVGFSEPNAQQCFGNNLFNFINSSTILTGSMQYRWTFGDGQTATTRNASHSYAIPGDYTVKMVVLSDKGCTDSAMLPVKIFKYAYADFKADPVCVNLRLPLFNQTINTASPFVLTYLWDFGNGYTSTVQNPVYSYPTAGTYPVKLTVSSVQCPQTIHEKQVDVIIDAPAAGIRYPDVEAVMNFTEQLNARQIGSTVLWNPPVSLNLPNSYRPGFKGLTSQLYAINLKTQTGCLTVDTLFVKVKKKIEIYVPTSFTPNGDGLNDYLYPVLMGFKKLNYFRVYNRWGKLLFQSQTEQPGWDGRFNGEKQDSKTVVWMVEAVDVDGVTQRRQGTTVLLR